MQRYVFYADRDRPAGNYACPAGTFLMKRKRGFVRVLMNVMTDS